MLVFLLEFLFHIFTNNINANWLLIILFSIMTTMIGYLLINKFKKIKPFLIVFLLLIYITQFIYYKTFETLLSFETIFNNLRAIDFYQVIINKIISNWYVLILFIIIGIGIYFISNKMDNTTKKLKWWMIIPVYVVTIILILIDNKGIYSSYNLYFKINIPNQNINEFGLLTSIRLDIQRSIIKFKDKLYYVSVDDKVYGSDEYNVLETNFPTDNDTIKEISEYLKNNQPTEKNDFTGILKGKNLIVILAESFSDIAINKEMTPTLYKMQQESFKFNYYGPTYRVGTADSEYVIDNSLLPIDLKTALVETNDSVLTNNIGSIFKQNGYTIRAYHNYDYDYYERNKYFDNMGYQYKACGNGLENMINCKLAVPSDYEMFNTTIDKYIDDELFFTYYVTMSGHASYSKGHSMVIKNYDLVKNLNVSEKSKNYLATQIELDRGLEALINKLEAKGKLKDTVILLVGDHYPYDLTLDQINELSDYKKDNIFEKVKIPFIIYNKDLKGESNKPCSQIDILPTLLNLFGINYDSRLYLGKDIMSSVSSPIIFQNRSFITEKGKFDSVSEIYSEGIDSEYIETIKNDMYYKYRMSRLILETDYFKYFK